MAEDKELAVIKSVDLTTLFTKNEIEPLLEGIEKEARSFIMPVDTSQGRAAMKSVAYRVAQAKVKIDNAGKELVAEWKKKAGVVDDTRKKVRDRLDSLRDEIRAPLTEWEAAEEKRKEAEKLAAEIEACYDLANTENELYDLRKKEAERDRLEAERLEKERLQKEKEEHDRLVAEEAARQATQEAEERAEKEIADARRREAEAKLAEERAEQARLKAVEDAEADKEKAVLEERRRAAEEAERKDRERAEAERVAAAKAEQERLETERLAANKAHRRAVNTEAVKDFVENGIEMEAAKNIVKLIIDGKISHITINY